MPEQSTTIIHPFPHRSAPSEADRYERSVERYSTDKHQHEYVTDDRDGLALCQFCGGWRERIEGRVTA